MSAIPGLGALCRLGCSWVGIESCWSSAFLGLTIAGQRYGFSKLGSGVYAVGMAGGHQDPDVCSPRESDLSLLHGLKWTQVKCITIMSPMGLCHWVPVSPNLGHS